MNFIICTLLASATKIFAKGPYLYHQNENTDEPLIGLITSHLTIDISVECIFIFWQSKHSSVSNTHDRLVAQFSPRFTSVLTFANDSLTESSLPVLTPKFQESCSMILYLNLDYFSESTIFPRNWFIRLPGHFTNSYHLIFQSVFSPTLDYSRRLSGTVSEFTLKKLPHPLARMIHRIFISVSKNNKDNGNGGYRCDLWNCDIFGKHCARLDISQAKDALTTKRLNLHGSPLIFAAVSLPNISPKALQDYIKYRKVIDVYITPFVEVSEYLNATPTLNQIQSQNFGALDKNGKWTGAAGEVVSGRAHISNGLITKDRYEALFLSKTIDMDGLTFATGPPPRKTESPFFLITSHDWRIWVALFLTIFLMWTISTQVEKKYFIKFRGGGGVLMFIISPLLEQPADSKRYQNFIKVPESRWTFGPWLLSIIALGTMFKTSLISTLTSPEVNVSPKNFKDLLGSGYKFNFLGASSTAGAVFNDLKAKGNLLVNELDKRIVAQYDPTHGEACISQTYGKPVACLGIGYALVEIGTRFLTEDSGQPLYYISRDYLFTSYYAFILSKKLPHLLATLDKMMYHYSESGSYLLFRKNVVSSATKYGKLLAKRKKQHNIPSVADSFKNSDHEFENILRTITLLGMGFSLATLVFIMELLYHYLSGFRVRAVRTKQN